MKRFLHVYENGDYILKDVFCVCISSEMITFFSRENGTENMVLEILYQ